jgi:hypothetical protein
MDALMQEVADSAGGQSEQRASIIFGGLCKHLARVSRRLTSLGWVFVDGRLGP